MRGIQNISLGEKGKLLLLIVKGSKGWIRSPEQVIRILEHNFFSVDVVGMHRKFTGKHSEYRHERKD